MDAILCQQDLGKAIYEAMLRYEASPGIFDISDEICGTVNEEDLAVAVEEMPELDPYIIVGDSGPTPGSTSATFRRSVAWPWTQTLFIDVFARWRLPLILCARTRLGTINHTLLSLEAVRARDIPLHGVAFIGDANEESETIIVEKGRVKRLGRLPEIAPLVRGRLEAVFAGCFNRADFA